MTKSCKYGKKKKEFSPKTKLSGLKTWPNGPDLTESIVPGSKSTSTARGTYFPPGHEEVIREVDTEHGLIHCYLMTLFTFSTLFKTEVQKHELHSWYFWTSLVTVDLRRWNLLPPSDTNAV